MLEQLQNLSFALADYNRLNDTLLYIDYINANYQYKDVFVAPDIAYRHRGNFTSLMAAMEIDPALYLYTMYVNGINNPVDFDGKPVTLKVPVIPPIPRQ